METAYAEARIAKPPNSPAAAPAVMFDQGYLAPAATGAEAAWAWPGGRGAGVRVVDVEQGWRRARRPSSVASCSGRASGGDGGPVSCC